MRFWILPLLLLLGSSFVHRGATEWDNLVDDFVRDYRSLHIQRLRIAYLDNLQGIQDAADVAQQAKVLREWEARLDGVDRQNLTADQQWSYDLLTYQLKLDLERIALEIPWAANPPEHLSEGGLAQVPNGKAWYEHYLKRWVDASVTPDELFAFGLKEVERVLSAMRALEASDPAFRQKLTGADRYFYTQSAVDSACKDYRAWITPILTDYFPKMEEIPQMDIVPGRHERLAQTPGYYSENTFYYNFFDKPYEKRQVPWLFMHEGVPGHHYEINFSRQLDLHPLQELFYQPGYSEGWAAYIEDIAFEFGAYRTPYEEYGKWEWDLIRSVRVPLDVGLNYYGWSDEKAMAFWRTNIQGIDDIGRRELARMKRWPCQVITYKYGARSIMRWKEHFEGEPGFDLKAFHEEVLKRGPLPYSVLGPLVLSSDRFREKN